MPIEIRELVIRATVEEPPVGPREPASSSDESEIVAECVEQVLEILRRRTER